MTSLGREVARGCLNAAARAAGEPRGDAIDCNPGSIAGRDLQDASALPRDRLPLRKQLRLQALALIVDRRPPNTKLALPAVVGDPFGVPAIHERIAPRFVGQRRVRQRPYGGWCIVNAASRTLASRYDDCVRMRRHGLLRLLLLDVRRRRRLWLGYRRWCGRRPEQLRRSFPDIGAAL